MSHAINVCCLNACISASGLYTWCIDISYAWSKFFVCHAMLWCDAATVCHRMGLQKEELGLCARDFRSWLQYGFSFVMLLCIKFLCSCSYLRRDTVKSAIVTTFSLFIHHWKLCSTVKFFTSYFSLVIPMPMHFLILSRGAIQRWWHFTNP